MTVLTAFANVDDGYITSGSAVYSVARTGGGVVTPNDTSANFIMGQDTTFTCYEGFIHFDTSSLTASANISSAVLSMWLVGDGSTTDFILDAIIRFWNPTLDASDYVSGATLALDTVAATINTNGIGATGAYKAFTETGTNLQTGIAKTGITYIVLASARHLANTQPTTLETITFATSDTAGTTNDPKLVVTYTVPPLAPTLTAPASSSTQNLNAGYTFTWLHNDPLGDTQASYQFRRKTGGGAYEYWNAGSVFWQSTPVNNTGSAGSVTFPAGFWTGANTFYLWSVATTNTNGVLGPFAADFGVTALAAAVVTVTGPGTPVTTTSTPAVTWTYAPGDQVQQTFQVKIESGAYGAAPGSGTPVQDSGEIASTALTWTPASLPNTVTYRAFVRNKTNGLYSAWASITFTMNIVPPSAPTLAVGAYDAVNNRLPITVTGTHTTAGFPTTTFRVEYSDNGTTWLPLRGAQALPGSGTPGPVAQTTYDYEAPSYKARQYRAFTDAVV